MNLQEKCNIFIYLSKDNFIGLLNFKEWHIDSCLLWKDRVLDIWLSLCRLSRLVFILDVEVQADEQDQRDQERHKR